MSEIPREEMELDLANTSADEKRCAAIVENIEGFMRENGGENRSAFATDLLRWRVHLESAQRLRVEIKRRLALP